VQTIDLSIPVEQFNSSGPTTPTPLRRRDIVRRHPLPACLPPDQHTIIAALLLCVSMNATKISIQ